MQFELDALSLFIVVGMVVSGVLLVAAPGFLSGVLWWAAGLSLITPVPSALVGLAISSLWGFYLGWVYLTNP